MSLENKESKVKKWMETIKKFLFRGFFLFCILLYLYHHYIYYLIPYNPLVELTTDPPISCDFRLEGPRGTVYSGSNDNLKDHPLIFKYFCDLKIIPLKEEFHWDEIHGHESDYFYSYHFYFGHPTYSYVFIKEIWLDDLAIFYISSDIPRFKDGYYKMIDGKFDYQYINKLITSKQSIPIKELIDDRINEFFFFIRDIHRPSIAIT